MPVRPLAALALALCLSACGLPAGGPTGASFPEAAAPPGGEPPPFALIEADAAVARALVIREAEAAGGGLEDDGAALGQRIAIGDLVQVSLFEPTGGGLLADQGGTRALPAQAVDDGGAVRIPFAGDVRVAGLSPPEAARAIERRLEGQAIEPQALVVIQDSAKRSVAVLGDAVEGGGQIRLTGGGERLLDVLAAAHETEVRLTRAGRTTSIDAETLLARPEQNVHVRPRDVIVVEHRPRRFSVLGAASENAQIPFGQSRLSLAEALAKARGLVDTRADPAGVFLARYETAETLAAPSARPRSCRARRRRSSIVSTSAGRRRC